jgi:hypothetical protein
MRATCQLSIPNEPSPPVKLRVRAVGACLPAAAAQPRDGGARQDAHTASAFTAAGRPQRPHGWQQARRCQPAGRRARQAERGGGARADEHFRCARHWCVCAAKEARCATARVTWAVARRCCGSTRICELVSPAAPWRALRVGACRSYFARRRAGLITRTPRRAQTWCIRRSPATCSWRHPGWTKACLRMGRRVALAARSDTRRSRTQLSPLRRASGEGGGPGADPAGATRRLRAREPRTS